MVNRRSPEFPWLSLKSFNCFGCSPRNSTGLGLATVLTRDGISCQFRLTKNYESYPGIVHGGIATTILDELMAHLLAHKERRLPFTVSLHVRFLAPLRIGATYSAHARLAHRSPALYKLRGEILDESQSALIVADGSYKPVTVEQVTKTMALKPEDLPRFLPFLG